MSDALRTTIPSVRTSFVGRKRDILEAGQLLAVSRLVTLTGAAGCGKTRLALRVAAEVNPRYADGIHWVELAPLAEPALVPQAVAKVLRVAEQPGRPVVQELVDALNDRHLLLVLDNCEHLLSACSQLVDALLAATEISILATSREPIGVAGEIRYPVPPLALPPATLPLEQMRQFDAIKLFVERARAILPDFVLTADNAAVVWAICRHLDGLPLAIELASALVNILTVEQIAARLDDRFKLLAAAPHVTYSYHRTLHAAIDWSYHCLTAPEQTLLRRLWVFAGGCSLVTAETVCAGDGLERGRVLELLSSLVNKSLVVAQTLGRREAHYSLLETIREYAREKLIESGESPLILDRHLQHFLEVVEETMPKLSGQYQQLWLDWLEGEYDNIRAAMSWSLESGRTEAGLRFVVALYQFWVIRNYTSEGLAWVERLLAQRGEGVSVVVRANALAYASFLAGFQGETSAQMRYGQEAEALAETAGEVGKLALAWALAAQSYRARAAGDYETEFTLDKRVIQLCRELGDKQFLALTLSVSSPPAMVLGKYDEAHAQLNEALTLLRELGNPYRTAMALNYCGDLARCEQDYARAKTAYEESIALLRDIGAMRDLASVLHNLGHACLHLGEVEWAQTLFSESMEVQLAQRNNPGALECLIGFAALAVTRGMPSSGARILAAVTAIGGKQTASVWAATRMELEYYIAAARGALTEAEFQAEQAAGRALSLEQAVEYAQNLLEKPADTLQLMERRDELTVRERQVAALVALGKSNAEIADELVVSKRTVEKHIAHILSKLGFTARSQIVRWGVEIEFAKSAK